VHETADDLRALQRLLDRSYERAGAHLREITDELSRLTAEELSHELQGMCLLVLATVTRDCRPLCGSVDGVFFRGAFYFGSSPDSVRFRHIRSRPHVSATHLPREELSVTVHGRAVPIDIKAPEHADYRATLLEIYVPRYGPEWEQFLDRGPLSARLDADKMFTIKVPPTDS
jgi:nitroimidazol reductase NimA-like FMN-containing flavoprotein (pyridoxamine 5'-phosphate oxidase superfamily)